VPGASQCEKCPAGETTTLQGSATKADCHSDPTIVAAQAQAAAAKAQAEADEQRQTTLIIALVGAILMMRLMCLRMHLKAAEARVLEEEKRTTEAELRAVETERNFFRDWRVKAEDLTFDGDKPIAKGAEGQVWKGKLRGHMVIQPDSFLSMSARVTPSSNP
jgi:hypothetical protein